MLAKLEESGLSAELITDAPFGLCSVDELERMAQLIQQIDIQTFMDPKVADPEKQQWMFDAYIQYFARENGLTSSALFQDVYDQIFEEAKQIARK